MIMLPFAGFAAALVAVIVHYEILGTLFRWAPAWRIVPRQRMLGLVLGALASHLLQILVFATVLWGLTALSAFDALGVGLESSFEQALYISIESYTSLGSAETIPVGPLRLFCGIEALSGLLIVGWTSAFTYLAMAEFWRAR